MAGKCEQTIYIYIKLILWPGTVKGISYSLILVDILWAIICPDFAGEETEVKGQIHCPDHAAS